MKSCTSTILLTMLLGCAMAADSDRTLRRKLSIPPPNIDMVEAGGFVSLSQLKHSSNSEATEYGNTLEYASEYGNTIRNSYGKGKKGKGATPYGKGSKAAKVPGINPYPSKDCPKKRKDGSKDTPKGGGKYSKKSAAPSVSAAPSISEAPSTSPSQSHQPSASSAPSAGPSESFKPSGWWCQDTEAPSISPAPTESSAPSGSPTVSAAPSTSHAPSMSFAPSSNPSQSHQPSDSSAPSLTPSVSGAPSLSPTNKSAKNKGAEGPDGIRTEGETQSSCNLYTATFDGNTAVLCNPAETQCGDGDATAAVTSDIESLDLSGTVGYNVDVTIEVADGTSGTTISDGLDETLTEPVTLALVGCAGKARNVALEHYRSNSSARRRLQDGTAALMNKWSCDARPDRNNEVTCATSGNYEGDLTKAELEERLRVELAEYLALMDNIYDWYPMQSVSGIEIETTNDVNSATGSRQSTQNNSIAAGPFIGAATGMLAVLLLLVLFVRRRNRYDQENVSHLKLDDDEDDDTFYNGSEASNFQNEYNTRDVHIVGEGDSVVSHWTGYTGNEKPVYRDGIMRNKYTDVHQCSSATCEICDKKRQAGVSFISTRTASFPSRSPSLPSDASRDYMADDTVQL